MEEELWPDNAGGVERVVSPFAFSDDDDDSVASDSSAEDLQPLHIKVTSMAGEELSLQLHADSRVSELRHQLRERWNVDVREQMLLRDDVELSETKRLGEQLSSGVMVTMLVVQHRLAELERHARRVLTSQDVVREVAEAEVQTVEELGLVADSMVGYCVESVESADRFASLARQLGELYPTFPAAPKDVDFRYLLLSKLQSLFEATMPIRGPQKTGDRRLDDRAQQEWHQRHLAVAALVGSLFLHGHLQNKVLDRVMKACLIAQEMALTMALTCLQRVAERFLFQLAQTTTLVDYINSLKSKASAFPALRAAAEELEVSLQLPTPEQIAQQRQQLQAPGTLRGARAFDWEPAFIPIMIRPVVQRAQPMPARPQRARKPRRHVPRP